MSVYFITGKLGAGKTLVTVGKLLDYLKRNMRVASNLDLFPEAYQRPRSKQTVIRLPDKPRVADLELLGKGNETADEENNGAIFLDECGTWLNARTWADPERKAFIDWMLHARKLGWDIYFIIQDISIVDKQVRMALCEHLVICKRLDRLQVPLISPITKLLFGIKVTFPKVHRAIVYYGDTTQDLVADKWTYQAKHLYSAYDTRQAFTNDEIIIDDEVVDMRATYTLLSRWHTEGRYLEPLKPLLPKPRNLLEIGIYPTWLLIKFLIAVTDTPARRVGVS